MAERLLFVANVDWFFLSHRLPIAVAARQQGYQVHIATGLTDRRAELEAHGLIVHPIEVDRGGTGVFSTWRAFAGIYRAIGNVRPDIVHLVTIKPVLLGGLAARLRRVPAVVAAVSGLGFVFIARGARAALVRWLVGHLYRAAFGHPNIRVVFQNPVDKSALTRLAGLRADESCLLPGSGVDLARYAARPFAADPPLVILAARLLIDKGVREFVEAARILRRAGSDNARSARFALVGDADLENPASLTRRELADIAAEGVVEFWGHRTDMPEMLAAAHVVVLPSYREGLPKVLIEAAACGRPVVTTDVPGCRDAIAPGRTGLLVPARDAPALAAAILTLLESAELREEMGRNGRALAERLFDVRSIVGAHLGIYRELLQAVR